MDKYSTGNLFGDEAATPDGGVVVSVAFEAGVDCVFSYVVPDGVGSVAVGQRVEVPFGRGNKPQVGFVVGVEDEAAEEESKTAAKEKRKFKLKAVRKIVDIVPLLNDELMSLARWISSYYVCPLGQVLAAMVPGAVKKGAGVKTQRYVYLA
ncbi:MAG: hypothetical protein KAS23_16315, partial [Anaerohalosphaera sp.]|nr:hypothetical protein [Anaerohalosphaera sp.]